ncbi:MAG: lipopolysaccharide biosynthesis protein [Actinomycetota bacterium]|nr:lipopolysaccharide biosynthesis protein [Actinomycetota bacterium]
MDEQVPRSTPPSLAEPQAEGVANPAATLLGRGGVYTVVTLVQSFSVFLVLPVLSRELGPRQYGVVATCVVVYQLLLVLAPVGLNAVVPWDYYERKADGLDRSRRLGASAWLVAIAVVAFAHFSGPAWSGVLEEVPYGGALTIAVLSVVPGTALLIAQAMLQAQARPVAFATCTLASVVGGQLVGLALVLLTDGGARCYLAGLAFGAGAGGFVGYVLTGIRPWRLARWSHVAGAVRHGGPTAVHGAAFILLASGDRVVIERLLGLDDAGRYHVAYLVGAIGLSAIQSLNNAWGPMVYGSAERGRWELLASTTSMMYTLALFIAGGVAIGAPLPLRLLLPDSFDPEGLAAVCAIVGFCVVPTVTYLSGVHVVFRQRRTVVLAWTTPLAGVVNIVLNMMLIPIWGLAGSAVATLLSYVLWAGLVRRAANRAQPVLWDRGVEVRTYVGAATFVAVGATIPAAGPWLGFRAFASCVLLVLMVRRTTTWLRASTRAASTTRH